MVYQDRWEIALKIEDKDFDLMPSTYSFVISDSIYRLYPRLSFALNDDTSLYQEFLSTVEGIKYELTYGVDDDLIKCPFVIKNDELPQNTITGLIGGEVTIEMVHEYYAKQKAISKLHSDTISKIIDARAGDYTFNSKTVDTTIGSYDWYQPLVSDAEFMLNNLLPFSYSSDSGNSPFYLFIDANNDFYFKSFKKMYDQNPVTDLFMTSKNRNGSNKQSIFNYGRYRIGSDVTKKLRHRLVCQIDDSNADFLTEDDYITDYPSGTNQVPIKYDDKLITSYMWLDHKEDDSASKNNNKGFKINSMRNGMLLDKVVIQLPLNPNLRSGKTVNIVLPYGGNGEETTLLFSGKYLIDRSWQVWDGKAGSTILSIGRKEANVPSQDYILKDLLAKG